MLIQSINFLNPLEDRKSNSNFKTKDNTIILPAQLPPESTTDVSKVYAYTMPGFKSKPANNIDFDLILSDDKIQPEIKVKINKNTDLKVKPGFYIIYQMALNDQIFEELEKNPNIKDNGSYIHTNSRFLNIKCPQKDLPQTIKMVKDKFINFKLDKKHFEEAKSLAPILYELDRTAGYYSTEFSDIPKEMSVKEYTQLIDKISYNDLLEYNNSLINNSEKILELKINKDFYNERKQEIDKALRN